MNTFQIPQKIKKIDYQLFINHLTQEHREPSHAYKHISDSNHVAAA